MGPQFADIQPAVLGHGETREMVHSGMLGCQVVADEPAQALQILAVELDVVMACPLYP